MNLWSNRPIRIALIALGVAVVVGAGLAGARPRRGDPADARQVAAGRVIYAAHCAACHGAALEGQAGWQEPLAAGGMPAPPHDATGHTWHHPDALLFAIVKEGGQASSPPGYVNRMPGFAAQLSDAEIWAVLAYIKSSWPDDVRRAQQAVSRQGP